ncbi:DUF4192 domain-containing protein [Nocardiopsis sp. MG754419]|uniref:DUF4192 domain-containing protein n=1 Tax=Nocardiopsis sp. MG754419 TaxID=2259865 RepID=UPI001BA9D112|nr:DUF4192 domain-containing protein [Nocardiopsis sp. MG754419]
MPPPRPAPSRSAPHLSDPRAFLAALPTLARRPLDDAIVVLVLNRDGPRGVLHGTLDHLDRVLTTAHSGVQAVRAARELAGEAALLAGFGPPGRVGPHVRAFLAEAERSELSVLAALRVTGDRFWSTLCEGAGCCPAEGTPFDPRARSVLWKPPDLRPERGTRTAGPPGTPPESPPVASPPPSRGTVDDPGLVRVRALLEPVDGTQREAVAVEAALLEEGCGRDGARGSSRLRIRQVRALVRAEEVERVTAPAALAMLGVHLLDLRVRDALWARITPEVAPLHVRLWSRVARHVPRRLSAGPASLLAVAAWQAQDRLLAREAVEAALAARPGYGMAVLMERALGWGLSAERWARHMAEHAGAFEIGGEEGQTGAGPVPPPR